MTAELKQAIGVRVKHARENAGLTQERLAELVDRTKDAISSIERGINFPALETLYKISATTNTPVSLMVDDHFKSRRFANMKASIDMLLMNLAEKDIELCLSIIELIANRSKSDHGRSEAK